MLLINACGTVERTSRRKHIRGKERSSANFVVPVTLARPSTRRKGLPTMFGSREGMGSSSISGLRIGSAIFAPGFPVEDFGGWLPLLAPHLCGSPFHALDDLVIPGAAAEIAGQGLADLVAVGPRIVRQQ